MCKHLANKGFNVLIIARNKSKIEDKIAQIQKEVTDKSFKTDYVLADFGKLSTTDDYNQISNEIKSKGIDVGILCLNAGIGSPPGISKFSEYPNEHVEQLVNINVGHVTYLLKAMMPQMISRQ